MRRQLARVSTGVLLLVATTCAAAAQDDATSQQRQLQQQVAELKQLVAELQSRVADLERSVSASGAEPAAQPTSAAPVAPSVAQTVPANTMEPSSDARAAPREPAATSAAAVQTQAPGAGYVSDEARLKLNWSKVTRDMDETTVTALLGAPSKKTTLDGRTVWYYYYPGTGAGSVFFTDAGRVSSRQTPFGSIW